MPSPSERQLARILSVQDEYTARIQSMGEPVERFRHDVLAWYQANAREFPWRDPGCTTYETIMSEILLWRSRADNVAKVYPAFVARYRDWTSLSRADEEELARMLRPIGYVGRAKTLVELAKTMACHAAGAFTRDQLQALPGVGQYVASAVLCICQGQREPLLDVNVARLLERFFGPRHLSDIRHDPYLQQLARTVLPIAGARDFNWAMLDFASLVCHRRAPGCRACRLRAFCHYAGTRESRRLPSTVSEGCKASSNPP